MLETTLQPLILLDSKQGNNWRLITKLKFLSMIML